jgi:rhodanese-related sulfurtransferase/rubrerythrin
MDYLSLHPPIKSLSAEQTRQIMESENHLAYQLVDVRQPGEYQQGHIPGALLMPLGEVAGRAAELDPARKTIVYCRSGVRSKSGCAIMARLGVEQLYDMAGGIMAWNGEQVEGGVDAGLEIFTTGAFKTEFELVYQMEDGLKAFYQALAARAAQKDERQLLDKLARFEDVHMHKLSQKYGQLENGAAIRLVEGGLDQQQMLHTFSDQVSSQEKILQLGMKLEAQAFDLYSRLARKFQGEETESFFNQMAAEEHSHLLTLAKELDNLI